MTNLLERDRLVELSVKPPMSRADKLNRLADLVEKCTHSLRLYHLLEHFTDAEKAKFTGEHLFGAFRLAAKDPVFGEAGMPENPSILDVQRFLELSNQELHEFSCDCGGHITNTDMAARIRRIAS